VGILLDRLAELPSDELASVLARVDERTAESLIGELHREIAERCARDGLFFLRFVQTLDEADAAIKSFPLDKPYVEPIWRTISTSKRVAWAKSRQMAASWIVCAYMVWLARFHPHSSIYFQSQADEDANKMISLPGQAEGRCQLIESHLPAFLKQQIRCSEGKIVYPNGSFIQALAGGANQIRGKVFRLYVGDEFAFQEEARGVYTSLAPLVQKQSQIILVSTPNGGPPSNQFASLYHGITSGEQR
jgi:hypothetical protein